MTFLNKLSGAKGSPPNCLTYRKMENLQKEIESLKETKEALDKKVRLEYIMVLFKW